MKIYLVGVLISLSLCVEQTLLESIEIRRFIGQDEDLFYIPRTVCDLVDSRYERFCASGHDICESPGTVTDNHYLCLCPPENATLTYRDNLWRCRENVEVRRHLGCEINNLFHNEDKIEPLRVLSKTAEERTKLNKTECYISPDISWYIGCDGKRETLKANQLQTSFGLEWNQGRRKAYFLKVLDDSYQGQIIKLGIRCTLGLPGYNNSCLLFKVQGNFSCPLGKQETELSSTKAAFSETTSTPSKVPRETSTQTKQSSTEGRFQPSSGVRQTDDSSSKVPVIVGVTASIIFTIVLFVVAFPICRRYKFRKRHNLESYAKNSSTSTAADRAVDEVTESSNDNTNVDGDYEYAYAGLRTDKREEEIYSSTYSVPQSPAVADASGSYPHADSAKEQIKNCQGNIEERFYDDVISLKCEPASENNEFAVLLFKQVDEVTESPNDNTNVDGDYEYAYAGLRTEKREEAIYSSTYSVPQFPAAADASGSYPHPDTAKEQIKNCQGNIEVDEVTESPNDNSNVDGDYEHAYAGLRTDKREEAIYSFTYSVPQSPAVADASGSYPHPDTAKEQIKNCQGNIEERFYDNVISLKCEPASKNNEPIDNELTVAKITEENCYTG
ncbi:uncharacterized protein [Montipora foliosa]|uniref:uncharacterized protein isoform X3 n=1 Tax=Montipora foliosa TaxID=591990 RepID=UPI0035F1A967